MMKCSKIILAKRNNNNKNGKIDSASNNKENQTLWFTTKYHGYSYKLSARCKKIQPPVSEAQLTITTLIFPENFSYNTGSSLDRWSRKTPNLLSSKRRNFTPRKNILFDEYDDDDDDDVKFDYPIEEFFNVQEIAEETKDLENNNDYFVASDIEELLLKSQKIKEEFNADAVESVKKQNNCAVKKKRDKLRRKTIRYSLSKPPSPQTEQIIRVDVTSSVSVEDFSAEESIIISVKKDDLKKNLIESNSTDEHVANEEKEENFIIVKCRQLALAQKK